MAAERAIGGAFASLRATIAKRTRNAEALSFSIQRAAGTGVAAIDTTPTGFGARPVGQAEIACATVGLFTAEFGVNADTVARFESGEAAAGSAATGAAFLAVGVDTAALFGDALAPAQLESGEADAGARLADATVTAGGIGAARAFGDALVAAFLLVAFAFLWASLLRRRVTRGQGQQFAKTEPDHHAAVCAGDE